MEDLAAEELEESYITFPEIERCKRRRIEKEQLEAVFDEDRNLVTYQEGDEDEIFDLEGESIEKIFQCLKLQSEEVGMDAAVRAATKLYNEICYAPDVNAGKTLGKRKLSKPMTEAAMHKIADKFSNLTRGTEMSLTKRLERITIMLDHIEDRCLLKESNIDTDNFKTWKHVMDLYLKTLRAREQLTLKKKHDSSTFDIGNSGEMLISYNHN